MEETNVGQSKEGCRERESKRARGAPRAPLASASLPSQLPSSIACSSPCLAAWKVKLLEMPLTFYFV